MISSAHPRHKGIRRPRLAHPALVQDEQLLKVPMGKYEHINVKFNFTGNSLPGLSKSHGAVYGSAPEPGRFLAGSMWPAPERSTVSADAPKLSSGQIAGLAINRQSGTALWGIERCESRIFSSSVHQSAAPHRCQFGLVSTLRFSCRR